MGLNAFSLFKNYKMALFFLFALLLGASLQLTNAYGDTFLQDFAKIPAFKDLLAVKYPAIIMSISQISETLFILTIPFFLRKFGIKKVMLISNVCLGFTFRIIRLRQSCRRALDVNLSCKISGMAFDILQYFQVPYSWKRKANPSIRASAQGLFMMMTNGFGAFTGSRISGIKIDNYYILPDGTFDWRGIWLAITAYSLIVAILVCVTFSNINIILRMKF